MLQSPSREIVLAVYMHVCMHRRQIDVLLQVDMHVKTHNVCTRD
jgi:hypothetical protein